MTWRDQAACRGTDVSVFFPEVGNSNHEAKRVCSTCPVRRPCLEASEDQLYGVWAGMSPDERAALSGRRITAAPAILDALADGRWWFTRDLAAAIGKDRNTVQKALRRLGVDGVLEVQHLGGNVNKWRWPAAVSERVHDVVTTLDEHLADVRTLENVRSTGDVAWAG